MCEMRFSNPVKRCLLRMERGNTHFDARHGSDLLSSAFDPSLYVDFNRFNDSQIYFIQISKTRMYSEASQSDA